MGESIFFLILLQIFLIALNAIFASAEIAVLSTNETKLERMADHGDTRAKRLVTLTKEPARFLATIQVAITLSGFLGSAFAADNFSEPLVDWVISTGVSLPPATLDTIAVIFITLVLSYFTLVFGELVPKRLAMKKSESIALAISGLVSAISKIFKPLVWMLTFSTNIILRLFGIDPNAAEDEISEEEIRMMVDAGNESGAIDDAEKEFIQNVFEFNDITAGDIVTHRTDVTILFLEEKEDEWAEIIHSSRHTRYPVCDGSPDKVVGVLNAKDYFRLNDKSRENVMKNAVQQPYFVPKSIKADLLFRNMKKSHKSFAVILDEFGGMLGIVTFYDLIAELVGNLVDEPENILNPVPYIEKIDVHTWKTYGNISLSEIEATAGIDFGNTDFETLTGLAFNALAMVPADGDVNIEVETNEVKIHILKVVDHRIDMAVIYIKPKNSVISAE